MGRPRSVVSVLLLSLLTCGLYYIYWVYTTSRDIQAYLREPDIPPVVELLLTFFTAGLYLFYWDWKTAQQIARMQAGLGLPVRDNSLLFLVFDVLGAGPIYGLGIVVPLIQQNDLNGIWETAARRGYRA